MTPAAPSKSIWAAWINLTPRQRAELRCTIGSGAVWLIVPCLPLLVVAALLVIAAAIVAAPAFIVSHFAYRTFHDGEREWKEANAGRCDGHVGKSEIIRLNVG